MSASPNVMSEDCHVLTPAQETVLSLISAGSTTVAAAEAAGVHRNTVLNWRRNSAHFRAALCRAREEKGLFWRDQNG
jgi:DNA-binding CsgD family transcriptional regulator